MQLEQLNASGDHGQIIAQRVRCKLHTTRVEGRELGKIPKRFVQLGLRCLQRRNNLVLGIHHTKSSHRPWLVS
jgi:hypothetical protein